VGEVSGEWVPKRKPAPAGLFVYIMVDSVEVTLKLVVENGGEIVITKHRVSAFAGTDLGMILRANDIDTLILFGIATSGVVLSTLLEASDADFRLAVILDCCADLDADLHDCLIHRFFPSRAAVLSAHELTEGS